MADDLTTCAARALHEHGAAPLPLARLYRSVAAEMGGRAGSSVELYDHLSQRRDLFILLEPSAPSWEASWPIEDREAYRASLQAVGLDPSPRVALRPNALATEPSTVASALRYVAESLDALRHCRTADAELDSEIAEAVVETGALGSVDALDIPMSAAEFD